MCKKKIFQDIYFYFGLIMVFKTLLKKQKQKNTKIHFPTSAS